MEFVVFRLVLILCCILLVIEGRAQSDLSLRFEANDFVAGIPVNQNGAIRFTVTNNGPDDFFPPSEPIKILGSYNYIISDGNPFGFFSAFNSNDPTCLLAVEHFDPPPPVNNYGLFMWGTIYKHIPAQSSVMCEFNASIQQMAFLDMQWQIAHIDDPNMDNNTQQFTFRGLAASVPVNNRYLLVLFIVVLLISAWRYRPSKRI